MITARSLSVSILRPAAVALGTFDGLHLGHQAVIRKAVEQPGCTPTVISFQEHPRLFLNRREPGRLMTAGMQSEFLAGMGVGAEILLDFGKIRFLPPGGFLDLLCRSFPVKFFVCGYDYRFGKDASGTTGTLVDYGRAHGIEVFVLPPVIIGGQAVSSTAVRDFLSSGRPEDAARFLGRPFSYDFEVLDGDRRGRIIGFPTINQLLPENFVLPRFGVYVSRTIIGEKSYRSVTNVGHRPTYRLKQVLSETHIIGFSGDLYGRNVKVELLHFLRGETRFASLSDLKAAIEKDLRSASGYPES